MDDWLYCPRCEKPTEWTVEHDLRCDGDERFEFDHRSGVRRVRGEGAGKLVAYFPGNRQDTSARLN